MLDPIVALLSKQPLPHLTEMRNGAKEQIAAAQEHVADLQRQLAWIERAINERTDHPAPRTSRLATPRRAGRRKSPKRDAILAILALSDRSRAWSPQELRDELDTSYGIDSSPESVRILLRRMLQDGEVARGGPNQMGWKLPSNSAAAEQAPPDGERSAAGYAPQGALAVNGSAATTVPTRTDE